LIPYGNKNDLLNPSGGFLYFQIKKRRLVEIKMSHPAAIDHAAAGKLCDLVSVYMHYKWYA